MRVVSGQGQTVAVTTALATSQGLEDKAGSLSLWWEGGAFLYQMSPCTRLPKLDEV